VTAGCVISRRGHSVLLLRTVVGISDDEKFLQREADNRNAHTTQVNSNIMMDNGVAVACNLSTKNYGTGAMSKQSRIAVCCCTWTSNSMKSAPDLEAVTNERTVFSWMCVRRVNVGVACAYFSAPTPRCPINFI
jgi:hypothetical protein